MWSETWRILWLHRVLVSSVADPKLFFRIWIRPLFSIRIRLFRSFRIRHIWGGKNVIHKSLIFIFILSWKGVRPNISVNFSLKYINKIKINYFFIKKNWNYDIFIYFYLKKFISDPDRSGSETIYTDPAKSFGSDRIRIRDTAWNLQISRPTRTKNIKFSKNLGLVDMQTWLK